VPPLADNLTEPEISVFGQGDSCLRGEVFAPRKFMCVHSAAKEGKAMLVLTRKPDQSIMIGNDIEITILEVRGEQVRLGIRAPRSVSVHRKEIYEQIRQENQNAANSSATNGTLPSLNDLIAQP